MTYQMIMTSASVAAPTFPSPANTSTFSPVRPIAANVFFSLRPVSSLPTVAMNLDGRVSSGASRNMDAVGVEIPDTGSLELPFGWGEASRASSEVRTPERMAMPMVPHPSTASVYPIFSV